MNQIEKHIPQRKFAVRLGMISGERSQLLDGEAALAQDIAARLETATGIPAHFWLRLKGICRSVEEPAKVENVHAPGMAAEN